MRNKQRNERHEREAWLSRNGHLPDNDELKRIITRLSGVKHQADGSYTALCPTLEHGDTNASLSVSLGDGGRVLIHCFGGCNTEDVVKAMGLEMYHLFPPRSTGKAKASGEGLTLDQYAEAKRLPVELLTQRFGFSTYHSRGVPRVAMPYLDQHGSDLAMRYRLALAGADRFIWRKRSTLIPYGLRYLETIRQRAYVWLVEGESDVHTLTVIDEPALGVPGANTWKEDKWARNTAPAD